MEEKIHPQNRHNCLLQRKTFSIVLVGSKQLFVRIYSDNNVVDFIDRINDQPSRALDKQFFILLFWLLVCFLK